MHTHEQLSASDGLVVRDEPHENEHQNEAADDDEDDVDRDGSVSVFRGPVGPVHNGVGRGLGLVPVLAVLGGFLLARPELLVLERDERLQGGTPPVLYQLGVGFVC